MSIPDKIQIFYEDSKYTGKPLINTFSPYSKSKERKSVDPSLKLANRLA